MLLFIERYPYKLDFLVRGLSIRSILEEVVDKPALKLESDYRFEHVGYFYSKVAKDAVFILPKVVLTGDSIEGTNEDKNDTVFGASPMEILDFDSEELEKKFTEGEDKNGKKHFYKDFLSNLSIWIYRTISVYKKQCDDSSILCPKNINTESDGRKQKHNTLLDVIIALQEFNRKNQNYLTFIAKKQHSGCNKIQWTKTINHNTPIFQGDSPVYMDVVNKKKMVNFDEELLVIYYSILNYIHHKYSFKFEINLNYPLIGVEKMRSSYIEKKKGRIRLKQIKYKYFSDIALKIWNLCYAFFDREHEIAMNNNFEDYLLAKDFEHIFEVMIDSLISEGKDKMPKELTDQKDGKMVDHMFIGQSLIEQSDIEKEMTYYIGDSKYYKRDSDNHTSLGDTSVYKQYTYARNVVQWNLYSFLGLFNQKEDNSQPQLRDELTEGYNPIPNFFISARIPSKKSLADGKKYLDFEDDGDVKLQKDGIRLSRQFENRLFDRDTLLLCHYDVNFLFIVSLYGRNHKGTQIAWREKVQDQFRREIQDALNKIYDFYILQPKSGKECVKFIHDNFKLLNGKIYRPTQDSKCLVLALMKDKPDESITKLFGTKTQKDINQDRTLPEDLKLYFDVNPVKDLANVNAQLKEINKILTDESLEPVSNRIGEDEVVVIINDLDSDKIKRKTDSIYIGIGNDLRSLNFVSESSKASFIFDVKQNKLYKVVASEFVERGKVFGADEAKISDFDSSTKPDQKESYDYYLKFQIEDSGISNTSVIKGDEPIEIKHMKDLILSNS